MQTIAPPENISCLQQRCLAIAGRTLADIANELEIEMPPDLRRDKGWVGQLLEKILGADAKSYARPDFTKLNIELKTVPLDAQQQPMESTFVSTIPLLELSSLHWQTSIVYKKLQHVLWLPVEATRDIPLAQRRVGMGFLWQPDAAQMAVLQQDWQELSDRIVMGELEHISAHDGQVLQVRPKGANAKALCWAIGPEGTKIQTLPRGFYLRRRFAAEILQLAHCACNDALR